MVDFIGCFPGENTEEKIFNFINLFNLEKAGYWNSHLRVDKEWEGVRSVGCVTLSRRIHDAYGVRWGDDLVTDISDLYQSYPRPFIAYKDCQ